MDYHQYTERRAALVARLLNANACGCKRTARARVRDIQKLDEEWQQLTKSNNIQMKKKS